MKWNTESDSLCFSVRLGQPVLTKRGVLSRVSSVFDPLGVLPLLVPCQVLYSNVMEEEKALGRTTRAGGPSCMGEMVSGLDLPPRIPTASLDKRR